MSKLRRCRQAGVVSGDKVSDLKFVWLTIRVSIFKMN